MMALNDYLKQTTRFLRDSSQQAINPLDLIDYINWARREIAMRTQCVRILPRVSGAIVSVSVTAAGSGYTNPSVVISAPDYPSGFGPTPMGAQAIADASASLGAITSVNLTYGGDGYFQPSITITDSTGSGATAVAVMQPLAVTTAGQEVYPFSFFDLSPFPGVKEILFIHNISIIFSQARYSVRYNSFSQYQAYVRQYSTGFFQYAPSDFTQFGQGALGTLFFYPIPNAPYQFECDCICLPADLTADGDTEAIPDPWTDAVAYGAASRAYEELQNLNAATYYAKKFDEKLHLYSASARSGRRISMYGR